MKIFIMAQGFGSRWRDTSHDLLPSEYKQQIPFGDDVLIERTLRQVHGHDITLVSTMDFANKIIYRSNVVILTLPEPVGTLLDGIFSTCTYWERNDVVILLGDVIYSNAMIDKILNCKDIYAIFGRERFNVVTRKGAKELFALSVKEGYHHKILPGLVGGGKLWDLQKSLGISVQQIEGDYTDDIDSPQEYYQFYQMLLEAVIEDDKGE